MGIGIYLLPDGLPQAVCLHKMGQPRHVRKFFEECHAHLRVGNAQLSNEVHGTVAEFPRFAWPCDLEPQTMEGGGRDGVCAGAESSAAASQMIPIPPHLAIQSVRHTHVR